jgi:HlyD family secretion protein
VSLDGTGKWLVLLAGCLYLPGCSVQPTTRANASPPAALPSGEPQNRRVVRATGLIQALEWQSIRVPQLSGVGARITLTRLIPNGAAVSKGDLLVEFDRTTLLDEERDAKAKVDDLSHQLEEKKAQVKSDAAKRVAQLREAEADRDKAQLQLRKGPVLSDIDLLKSQARAENAAARVASLRKSDEFRRRAEQAAVQILELKGKRQQVALERIETNLERLLIRAPQDGMVSLETTWRNGSMGPSQEGDQVWPGMPILRIFNPSSMVVLTTIDEPDIAAFSKASRARLYLDAYPGAVFDATLESASPVATSGMDSQVRTFTAVFRIEQPSRQLLPDLSAALEVELRGSPEPVMAATPGTPKANP